MKTWPDDVCAHCGSSPEDGTRCVYCGTPPYVWVRLIKTHREKEKYLQEEIIKIALELDPDCPDGEAYVDGHCSISELAIRRQEEFVEWRERAEYLRKELLRILQEDELPRKLLKDCLAYWVSGAHPKDNREFVDEVRKALR